MLRKLAMAVAVTSLLAFPTTEALAGHGGGGHGGGGHGGGFHGGGFHGGGFHGGGRGGFRGGRGRYWGGRWYGYGVGPCWRWNPFFGGWVWICG
jgi:hypothetical protein